MDEDEILATAIGSFLLVFGIAVLYLGWKRQEEEDYTSYQLLDVV